MLPSVALWQPLTRAWRLVIRAQSLDEEWSFIGEVNNLRALLRQYAAET